MNANKTSLSNHHTFCSHYPFFYFFIFLMGTVTHTVSCADEGINAVQVDQSVVKSTAIFLQFWSLVHEYHQQINALLTHTMTKIM